MTSPDDGFSRKGVDPTSRCLRCGAAVAHDGRVPHLMWDDRIYGIADRLVVLERKMLELRVKRST